MIITLDPGQMAPEQRLEEVATILATGFLRFQKKQKQEKIPLDKLQDQCPYGRKTRRKGEQP